MRAARVRRAGWLVAAVGVLVGLPAEASRPLVVDGAEPVEPGRVQLEAGLELTRAPDSTALTCPCASRSDSPAGWRSAWVPRRSSSPRTPRRPGRRREPGDVCLAAKLALPFEPFGLALALAPSLKIPTADERRFATPLGVTWSFDGPWTPARRE